jgi:hypothetical protein
MSGHNTGTVDSDDDPMSWLYTAGLSGRMPPCTTLTSEPSCVGGSGSHSDIKRVTISLEGYSNNVPLCSPVRRAAGGAGASSEADEDDTDMKEDAEADEA